MENIFHFKRFLPKEPALVKMFSKSMYFETEQETYEFLFSSVHHSFFFGNAKQIYSNPLSIHGHPFNYSPLVPLPICGPLITSTSTKPPKTRCSSCFLHRQTALHIVEELQLLYIFVYSSIHSIMTMTLGNEKLFLIITIPKIHDKLILLPMLSSIDAVLKTYCNLSWPIHPS